MEKYFTEAELKLLSAQFSFITSKSFMIEGKVLKELSSKFYQNNKKMKARIINKPISKMYGDDEIL